MTVKLNHTFAAHSALVVYQPNILKSDLYMSSQTANDKSVPSWSSHFMANQQQHHLLRHTMICSKSEAVYTCAVLD